MSRSEKFDVVIVGAGSAAFEAAVACRQADAEKVVMLEKAPEDEFGGNARFSHTGFRFVDSGKDESGLCRRWRRGLCSSVCMR